MRTSDAKAGERVLKESGDDCRHDTKGVVIKFGNSMCVCSDVNIQILGDFELACWRGVKCCDVLDEICIDAQGEIKSGPKGYNSGSSLDSDTKSSFERRRPRCANDGQAVRLPTKAIIRLALDLETEMI